MKPSGKTLLSTGKKFDSDPNNVWFNIIVPPGQGDGWIPKANADEVPDPERPEVDPESFVRQCILVERSINALAADASRFVSADSLIARAIIETGIKNPGAAPGSFTPDDIKKTEPTGGYGPDGVPRS